MKEYAEKILAHHGYDPKCDKAPDGMMNHVFLSKDKVVRIQGEHSAKVSSFAAEKWAMERARENGAPVPKVIAVDESKTIVPVSYMLMERLPGKSWSKPTPELCTALGAALSRIHSVETTGYGRINNEGKGKFDKWSDYVDSRRSYLDSEVARFVQTAYVGKLHNAYAELEKVNFKPGLVHNDYHFGNVLVDNERLTGVIDFMPKSSSPYQDLGGLYFRMPDLFRYVEEGYTEHFDMSLLKLFAVDNITGMLPNMMKVRPQRGEELRYILENIVQSF